MPIKDLENKIVREIEIVRSEPADVNSPILELVFHTRNESFRMYHSQDCCEDVYLEDICGDLNDLIGAWIIQAEEVISQDNPKEDWHESYTWTFYKISSIKGAVTLRWYGASNGFYSEEMSFEKIK